MSWSSSWRGCKLWKRECYDRAHSLSPLLLCFILGLNPGLLKCSQRSGYSNHFVVSPLRLWMLPMPVNFSCIHSLCQYKSQNIHQWKSQFCQDQKLSLQQNSSEHSCEGKRLRFKSLFPIRGNWTHWGRHEICLFSLLKSKKKFSKIESHNFTDRNLLFLLWQTC